ncbi:type I pantothenate kinase, partial [Glaesserella parasuis]|nr:type I pantothenate kinase [Glaesserella parasuis]
MGITKITPFLTFNRQQWAALRKSVPLKLTEQDLKPLLGFNEELSLEEVSTIYLPLARLINYYIDENLKRQEVLHKFLDLESPKVPYIISLTGSVSVGKSTSARILQALLSEWPEKRKVDLITTDGFLYPLKTLQERNLMKRKGFPESYDIHRLIEFVSDIKSGKRNVKAPVYS